MKDEERAALSAIQIDWAPTKEDVWRPLEFHVEGINDHITNTILEGMDEAQSRTTSSPLGTAILGQKGAGKTHILCKVRQEVQREGGYFFLVSLVSGKDFWPNTSHALLLSLRRPMNNGESQLRALLRQLAQMVRVNPAVQSQLIGDSRLTREGLDTFIKALRKMDSLAGENARYTARALVLLGSEGDDERDIGESFLMSQVEATVGERTYWGIHPEPKAAQEVVEQISQLVALTGPSLLAFDQIEPMLAQSTRTSDDSVGTTVDLHVAELLEQIGGGLMDLREATQRTLTVVACLESTWTSIKRHALASVADRFRDAFQLGRIPSAAIGQAMIEARFRSRFERIGFDPPYATWPIQESAFENANRLTPRLLLQQVDAHIQACLAINEASELKILKPVADTGSPPPKVKKEPVLESGRGTELDARFAAFCQVADVSKAFSPKTEDAVVPELLSAGLLSWIDEQGEDRFDYSLDPLAGGRPAFHVRLRKTLDESIMDEQHWSIRSIASTNANAVINRINNFKMIAGLDPAIPKRRLFALKTGKWPEGPATTATVSEFRRQGGVVLDVDAADLAVFAALKQMRDSRDPDLTAWLLDRRPASRSRVFVEIFGPASAGLRSSAGSDGAVSTTRLEDGEPSAAIDSPNETAAVERIAVARSVSDTRPMPLSLEALRKHTAIFAGSGSGKTVLIRRIVEECALAGVSAIVLDPNNDLARLGDAWPELPAAWWPNDEARAARYLAETEVVVWTPRRELGRPITFQPLPDFAAVVEDQDEFGIALDVAVTALAPRAKVDTATAKSEIGRAVLRQALEHYVRQNGTGLSEFIDLLAELPRGVSGLARAPKLAAEMADTLSAAMINDPLFGGTGEPLDPGVLLTPSAEKKARISVISFIGLPSDEQRQSFVNQLQMSLFAWIKQNPAGDRPLGGLLVMDEAQTLAPSSPMTACTHSTIALAAQARKYGLGLLFATQAPKGIHNRIVGNAATQFFGFLNSPVQITAATEVAQSKGSGLLDISRLTAGQFYAVSEGLPFRKVETPMCLSYHPKSALTAEEVMIRAQRPIS